MDVMEDLYTTTFSNNESFFKKAAAEIESLRAQVAELKAENERLKCLLIGVMQFVTMELVGMTGMNITRMRPGVNAVFEN